MALEINQTGTTVLFLSTPSARRATSAHRLTSVQRTISIHALREEGDDFGDLFTDRPLISIHALREEGDDRRGEMLTGLYDFYPRPPRGGRLPRASRAAGRRDFYPRPPRGGRLATDVVRKYKQLISIHALREEGDANKPHKIPQAIRFLSTPSARRATSADSVFSLSDIAFLSTPSARRATQIL